MELGFPTLNVNANVGPDLAQGGNPQMRVQTIDLSVAQTEFKKFDLAGRFLWILTSTVPSSEIQLLFNEQSGQPLTLKRGNVVSGHTFKELWIKWSGSVGSITILTSMQILNIENAVSAVSTTLEVPGFYIFGRLALNNGSATLISANNTAKRRVKIQADKVNTVVMGLGGAALTAAISYGELAAGDSDEWETTADIYGFVAAAGQFVRFVDLQLV